MSKDVARGIFAAVRIGTNNPSRRLMWRDTGPIQVIEVDLHAGRARDASIAFADQILERTSVDELPPDVRAFVSIHSLLAV